MSQLFDLIPPVEAMHMEIDEEKDLSPFNDNGIRKILKQHGHGVDYPNSNDKVTLQYVAYMGEEIAPEYKFDSSDADGKDFVYEVCRGKVVRGFELAVMSMKEGERAIIYLTPEYAFGRAGAPPKVPRDTPIIFDTTVLRIDCQDLSSQKDKSVLKKVITKGKGWAQPNEGCMVEIHIKGSYDDTVFQDKDVAFPYGEGAAKTYQVPNFVEKFLDMWKIKETSRLFVKCKSAYGAEGYPDLGIPPDKDLTYIITMKNFERVKDMWEMKNEEKMSQCEMYRQKGNHYYKLEDYTLSLRFYERMLSYVEFDECMAGEEEEKRREVLLIAYLNKAMVLLKLQKYDEAKTICDKVINSDTKSIKAYYRRGMALFCTNCWDEAKQDFEEVVALDPTNKSAKSHISLCNQKIKEAAGTERKLYQNMMSEVGKMEGNDRHLYGSGMNDIDMWDNNMASGMMTLEQEREAFGETMPVKGDNNHGHEH